MPAVVNPYASPWAVNGSVQLLVMAEGFSLLVAYWAALRLLGPRYVEKGDRPASRRQVLLFCLGVVALVVAEGWPLSGLANNYLYSAHMVQHLIFCLVVPPLLLLGTPSWLVRLLVIRPGIFPVMKRITRPIAAAVIFNALLVASHWPAVVNLTLHNQGVHVASHLLLLFAGFILWWPVLSPLSELPRLSYPGQMLYLFVQTIIPTIPASFLTFASTPLYHFYLSVPRAFGISALNDTRISGIIMKLGMGLELWSVIAVIFFRWSSQEERPGRPDVLEWQAVERELNRSESKNP